MTEAAGRAKIIEIVGDLWDRGHANTTGVSISCRLDDGTILVDQTGTGFRKCRVSENDLLVMDLNCDLVAVAPASPEKKAPVNTAVHAAYYRNNPLAQACIHCHAPYSQVFACRNESIFPYTLQSNIMGEVPCVNVDDAILKKEYADLVPVVVVPSGLHARPDVYYVMQKVAEKTVEALRGREQELAKHGLAVTHFRHGIFVFARNLDEAFDNLERVEANARVRLLSASLPQQ